MDKEEIKVEGGGEENLKKEQGRMKWETEKMEKREEIAGREGGGGGRGRRRGRREGRGREGTLRLSEKGRK